ncbi:cell division cycle-related protein [Balamuthia mandrillaris]
MSLRRKRSAPTPTTRKSSAPEQKIVNPLLRLGSPSVSPQFVVANGGSHVPSPLTNAQPKSPRSPRGKKGKEPAGPISGKETIRANPLFQYYELINSSQGTKKVWNKQTSPLGSKDNSIEGLGSLQELAETGSSEGEGSSERAPKSAGTTPSKNKQKKKKKGTRKKLQPVNLIRIPSRDPLLYTTWEKLSAREKVVLKRVYSFNGNKEKLEMDTGLERRRRERFPGPPVSGILEAPEPAERESGGENGVSVSPTSPTLRRLVLAKPSPPTTPRRKPGARRTLSENFRNSWDYHYGLHDEVEEEEEEEEGLVQKMKLKTKKKKGKERPGKSSKEAPTTNKIPSESNIDTKPASLLHPHAKNLSLGGSVSAPNSPIPVSKTPYESSPDLRWEQVDGRMVITAGSLDKLIQATADSNQAGAEYIYNLLVTHTYFSDSITLLDKLKERYPFPSILLPAISVSLSLSLSISSLLRKPLLFPTFNMPLPSGLSASDRTQAKAKRMIIRLRVINVLKKWIENHFYFFQRDAQLAKEFKGFMNSMIAKGGKQKEWATLLLKSLEEKPLEINKQGDISAALLERSKDESIKPIMPMNIGEKLSFIDLHPLEVARQMTLVDHAVFRCISPTELYKCAWAKGDKTKAANVQLLTERFNKVCSWVATEIISTANPKLRVEVLSRFIQVAMFLRSMNNFHGVMQIYASLNLGCVQRLKTTWKMLPQKYIAALKEIEHMMDASGNYKNYRDRLAAVSPPLIPFQAVYLSDLTFIEEVPTMTEDGLINFNKMMLLGKVISEIERYQKAPYVYYVVPPIEEFLLHKLPIMEEKELYARAKANEEAANAKGKGGDSEAVQEYVLEGKKIERDNKKHFKEMEKQEKKLLRTISFKTQKTQRNRAATFT